MSYLLSNEVIDLGGNVLFCPAVRDEQKESHLTLSYYATAAAVLAKIVKKDSAANDL